MEMICLICSGCGIEFKRRAKEVRRSIAKGRTRSFCGIGCKATKTDSAGHLRKYHGKFNHNLRKGSEKDEYSLFKIFVKMAKYRHKWGKAEKYNSESNITTEYLSNLWKEQNGKCRYTGVDLVLRLHGESVENPNYTASLDRIDCGVGYIEGNVQFVSLTVNWLKNSGNSKHIGEFFKIVREATYFGDE